MPSSPRDKCATWRTTNALRHECGVPEWRLRYALENGLPVRTTPPGHEREINLSDPAVHLDIEDSTVSIFSEEREREGSFTSRRFGGIKVVGDGWATYGIEVLWPSEAEATADADETPSPSADAPLPSAPQTSPPPKTVSNQDLRNCILAIKEERPDAPLGRDELWLAVKNRLSQWVARDRVWAARKRLAPHWVGRRGRRRKPEQ